MDRPLAPQRERGLDVGLRLMRPPAVDRTEVLKGTLHVAHGNRPPEVLDFVAGRAQGDQPNKSLHAALAVVVPDFVGLDGVLLANTAANLALVATPRQWAPRRRGRTRPRPLYCRPVLPYQRLTSTMGRLAAKVTTSMVASVLGMTLSGVSVRDFPRVKTL